MCEKAKIIPEHKKILNKIRQLYILSGGEPLCEPEDWGLNENFRSEEGITIDFDYGVPEHMYTPIGYYEILGSNMVGNTKKFWDLLNEAFDVQIITPKRDDSKISELEFQVCYSGPLVRIKEKELREDQRQNKEK